jgi:FKBP-type peptidyl-prolyl cis-trans isomerase FkpA
MKKITLAVLACFIAGSAAALDKTMTEDQKTLYFLGKAVSSKIKQFDFSAEESKYVVMGFSEALEGVPSKVDDTYGTKLNEYLGKKQEAIVAKQKEAAKPFLEKMSKEPGAEKLPSGVVYIPVKEGTGSMPKASDMVKVHYHGTFPDGKVFDSSVDRGTPAEFPLSGVIPCWTEGVQKIKVGGKAKLVCPSDAAYGDQGAGGTIPGGATLVFDVELLDILKEPVAAAPAKAKPAKKAVAKDAKPAAKPAN